MSTNNTRLETAWNAIAGYAAENAHVRVFAAFSDTDDAAQRSHVIRLWANSSFLSDGC